MTKETFTTKEQIHSILVLYTYYQSLEILKNICSKNPNRKHNETKRQKYSRRLHHNVIFKFSSKTDLWQLQKQPSSLSLSRYTLCPFRSYIEHNISLYMEQIQFLLVKVKKSQVSLDHIQWKLSSRMKLSIYARGERRKNYSVEIPFSDSGDTQLLSKHCCENLLDEPQFGILQCDL